MAPVRSSTSDGRAWTAHVDPPSLVATADAVPPSVPPFPTAVQRDVEEQAIPASELTPSGRVCGAQPAPPSVEDRATPASVPSPAS